METFLGGLGILAIGGLVTVALRYPKGHLRIQMGLSIFFLAGVCSLVAYNEGVRAGAFAVTPFLDPAKADKAQAAYRATLIGSLWLFGSIFASGVFLIFVNYLPQILGPPKDHEKQGHADDVNPPPANG